MSDDILRKILSSNYYTSKNINNLVNICFTFDELDVFRSLSKELKLFLVKLKINEITTLLIAYYTNYYDFFSI